MTRPGKSGLRVRWAPARVGLVALKPPANPYCGVFLVSLSPPQSALPFHDIPDDSFPLRHARLHPTTWFTSFYLSSGTASVSHPLTP